MQLVELEVIYHRHSMEALLRIIPQLQQSIGQSDFLSDFLSVSLLVHQSVCLSVCCVHFAADVAACHLPCLGD